MKIDKLGFYRTRDNHIVEVTNLDVGGPFKIKGTWVDGASVNPRKLQWVGAGAGLSDYWTVEGKLQLGDDTQKDFIEYFSVEKYPELYI